MNFLIDCLLVILMIKNIKFLNKIAQIEQQPVKFPETRKDADQNSYFNLKIQNVLSNLKNGSALFKFF